DRPALVRAAHRAGRVAVRQRRARLQVPGPEGADSVPLLAELRPGRREVTVLVTGGTGFVGSGIVHALRAEDRPVRCLVRDARKASRLASWGCELAEGDVTDAASLRRAVEGCDRVIHLVAIRSGKRRDFERIMEQGTRDLVAAYFAQGLDLPEAANRTFELGGPDVVSWDEFWRRLRRALAVRRRPVVHVPVAAMRVQATLFEALPNPPLTRDLLKMLLAGDN